MHENRATGCRCPPGEAPRHACPPVENPTCAAFEVYEEVPKMVPLDFTEDEEEASEAEEEEGGDVLAGLGNLNIETAVTSRSMRTYPKR